MTDIVIKPSNSGGSVKLQTEGGTNGLTMASTGVLTTSGNVAVTGTVTGGTLGSGVTFPAGHIIQVKRTNIALTGSNDNQFSFSSSTASVVSHDSNNLEVTGFSASSGNILFVAWNYGLLETYSGNTCLSGFKVGSTF